MTIDAPVSTSPATLVGLTTDGFVVQALPQSLQLIPDNLINGIYIETAPLSEGTSTVRPTSGDIQMNQCLALQSGTITKLCFEVTTGGLTLLGLLGANTMGIYDTTGNPLATVDCTTAFTSTGVKTLTLSSPVTLTRGQVYWLNWVSTGLTPVTLRATLVTPLINAGISQPPYRQQRQAGTLGGILNLLSAIIPNSTLGQAIILGLP